ncbi:T9SS type B sorting domain-containing protein [Epilithonimonas sp. UC225_85]|uniref:T9SS type B sorting domain-containing protein n=1 Tax=Epilithonimonas sp. UC225_85 TaxID=3350167 RepID=UPI0036D24718
MKNILLLIALMLTPFLYSQSCPSITATDLFGNTSVELSCGNGACVSLTTNVPKTYLTTSYQVAPQSYAPIIPFDQGTPLNAKTDDDFSGVIPIPFNFCFYDKTYNKLVISTNGFITFDTTQAGLASNPNILANNPSPLLPRNSIFGILQDLIYSDTDDSEIYYSVIGTAPCRKFVVNFYKARITGCTETSTFQIVLTEFTNEININIENKPLPCVTARFKESLIGTMNSTGDDGLSPAGRNKGIWQSGNESWKFSPAGAEVQPNIQWKNSSNQIVGSTAEVNVCPTKTEKYTVTIDYPICGSSFILSDDIDINYSQGGSAPIINSPVNYSYTLCDNEADNIEKFDWNTLVTPLITTDPNVIVRYFETKTAAEAGGTGLTTIKAGQYTVYARVTNSNGCYAIGIVNMDITFLNKIIAKDIKKVYCFDGKQDVMIDLNSLYPEMLTTPISEITKVSFYSSQIDATTPNIGTEISSNQLIIKDGNLINAVFYVRFENADGCYTVRKITIELRNPVANQNQDICDFENNGLENITLSSLNSAIAGGQPVTISYFPDAASANANSGAITTYLLTSTSAVIYVRLDMKADNGDCFRVYPITLKLISSPSLTKNNIIIDLGSICDNNNDGVEQYDLTRHESEIYSGTENFVYSYYLNYNAGNGAFSNRITTPVAFSLNKSTEVFVRVSQGACFAVAKITINFTFLPAVRIKSGLIAKCDRAYDYGETYDLNDAKAAMFVSSENGDTLADMIVTYYATKAAANLGTPKISNLQTTNYNVVNFWARFESKNSHCFSVASITLKTYFPPKAIPSAITVCDNNLDGNPEVNLLLPEYTNRMVSEIDPENHFIFYLTPADIDNNNPIKNPENFSPSPFPSRIYVLVENLPGCYSLPLSFSTIDFTSGSVIPINQNSFLLEQCDAGNDGKEILNLSQFESQIYNTGTDYSYYPTLEDLNKNSNRILSPSAYQYDRSVHPPVIFVKAAAAGTCPSLVKININLKNTPIFELPDYYFCPGVGIRIEPDLSYLKPNTYVWKNPAGEVISQEKYITDIKNEGKYSLTITIDNGCSYTAYFNVIAYEVPVITQLIGIGPTSYQVIATGSRKILYSIDGIHWQESNIFENIAPGPVTFYVRYADRDCLGDTKDGLSVKVVNVITPNDDGKNDTWTFKNLDVFDDVPSKIQIYDRNGVLLHEQYSTDSFLWNGKFNGRSLPTTSYWYIMTLPDKTITGWILLKNRN